MSQNIEMLTGAQPKSGANASTPDRQQLGVRTEIARMCDKPCYDIIHVVVRSWINMPRCNAVRDRHDHRTSLTAQMSTETRTLFRETTYPTAAVNLNVKGSQSCFFVVLILPANTFFCRAGSSTRRQEHQAASCAAPCGCVDDFISITEEPGRGSQ